MMRKKKQYARPRKLYDKARITDENTLKSHYGLKNKREIWKVDAKIKYFRNRAKSLITAAPTAQQNFFAKLSMIGLPVKTIADVLALKIEDLLKRRLSTVVWKKGLARTAKQARHMIVHKKVVVENHVVDVPSYIVKVSEESTIAVKEKPKPQGKTHHDTHEERVAVRDEAAHLVDGAHHG